MICPCDSCRRVRSLRRNDTVTANRWVCKFIGKTQLNVSLLYFKARRFKAPLELWTPVNASCGGSRTAGEKGITPTVLEFTKGLISSLFCILKRSICLTIWNEVVEIISYQSKIYFHILMGVKMIKNIKVSVGIDCRLFFINKLMLYSNKITKTY